MPRPYDDGQPVWSGEDNAPVTSFDIDMQRRDIDVASEILELQPNATPFLVIGQRAAQTSANSLRVVWFDDELDGWWTEAVESLDDTESDNEFEVSDGNIFRKRDLIKAPDTGEVMLIEEINGDTLKVKRAYGDEEDAGGTEPQSLDSGANLMRMGNAFEENSLAPEPRATQPSRHYNYVQTFRHSFGGSLDELEESKKTNEDERTRLTRRKAVEHRIEVEKALLFGERNIDIENRRRTMGGLFQFLEDQYESADIRADNGGEDKFEAFLEDAFWYGSDEKLMITSPRVGSEISKFARERIQTSSGEETYGLAINTYQSFHGRLHIVTTQMFEKEYKDKAVILDMENIDIMPYAGKNTTLSRNIQENSRDGWLDEYITKMTLRVRLEKTHRVLENALG